MTTRKHFKQLVRDRMRQTGEKYTVARRHVEASAPVHWELRGGLHGETAAFANVLANLGVQHEGAPLSEAMILGVGGGLGAGYILWEFDAWGYRALTLGFRREWQYPARWAAGTAERLGLHAELHETGGAKAAAAALDAQLDRGLPAIVWIDPYRLGHRGLPESRDGFGGPPIVVYGRSGDGFLIDDRSTAREVVSAEALAAARARVVSYKHRLITIDPERVDLGDLRAAVEDRPEAAGRAPEREVGLVLAARVAQVGADDHRHAPQEGLADGLRRRPRDRERTRLDLHQRRRRRPPARAVRRLPRRGERPARPRAARRPPGARRPRRGRRSSTSRWSRVTSSGT